MGNCATSFQHDFTSNTLIYSNINEYNGSDDENASLINERERLLFSKIISLQTIKGTFSNYQIFLKLFFPMYSVHNNGLDVDLACLCWTLINKNNMSSSFYLTIFNLNNWYSQCMPNKLDKNKNNFFLNNFILRLDLDYTHIKVNIFLNRMVE